MTTTTTTPTQPELVLRLPNEPRVSPSADTGVLVMLDVGSAQARKVNVFVRGVFPVRARAFDYLVTRYTVQNDIVYPIAFGMRPTLNPTQVEDTLEQLKASPRELDHEYKYLNHGEAMIHMWQAADFEHWDESARAQTLFSDAETCVIAAVTKFTFYENKLWCNGANIARALTPRAISDTDFVQATSKLIQNGVLTHKGDNHVGLAYEIDLIQHLVDIIDELNARPIGDDAPADMSWVMFFETGDTEIDFSKLFKSVEYAYMTNAERVPINDDLLNIVTESTTPIIFSGNPRLRRPHACTLTMVPWPDSALPMPKKKYPVIPVPRPRIEFLTAVHPPADVMLTSDPLACAPRERYVRNIEDDEHFNAACLVASPDTTSNDLALAQAHATQVLYIVDLHRTTIPQRSSYLAGLAG